MSQNYWQQDCEGNPEKDSNFRDIPAPVRRALESQDPRKFHIACVANEYEPTDAEEQRLWIEGQSQVRNSDRKVNYSAFDRALKDRPHVDVTNRFSHIDSKRAILREAGYTHLTGNGGSRVPISRASGYMIGAAFSKTLIEARKHREHK